MAPQKLIISGFNGLRIYCKISSSPVYGREEKNYTISFGGKSEFCFIAAIKVDKPHICYIDRVEYNAACVVDGSLKERGGTAELVKLALWTIVSKFPDVTTFTFKDDSYVHCEKGSKINKLSLAHDFIVKYNQTWYQRNFNAELPPEMASKFLESLSALDRPIDSFDFMSSRLEALRPYQTIYENSDTPRSFINSLRGPQYCFEVGKWIEQYISLLDITTFKDSWFIRRENIAEPPNYSITETNNNIRGGGSTRKNRKHNFSLVTHNSFGGYNN
jgi:hypothetical protein